MAYNHSVVGMWRSLVARIVRDDEAAGSNPVIPTTFESKTVCMAAGGFFLRGKRFSGDSLLTARGKSHTITIKNAMRTQGGQSP